MLRIQSVSVPVYRPLFVRWLALLAVLLGVGCQLQLEPRTPRETALPDFDLSLAKVRATSVPHRSDSTGLELEVVVMAWTQGAVITEVRVAEPTSAPCSGGTAASYVRASSADARTAPAPLEPSPGQTLIVGFPRTSGPFVLRGPSRLDLVIRRDGAAQCATLPLAMDASNAGWDTRPTFTVAPFFGMEGFSRPMGGLTSVVFFGGELGRWYGPMHVAVTLAGGLSQCTETRCQLAPEQLVRNRYYLPVSAGIGATLLEFWIVSLDVRAHYRAGLTAVPEGAGERRVVLHGPVLTPSLMLSLPAFPLPFGVRGLRSGTRFAFSAPLGFVMSSQGGNAFSAGVACAFEVPLR